MELTNGEAALGWILGKVWERSVEEAKTAVTTLWSSTDFPYACLKDRVRTLAFRQAIRDRMQRGAVVIDAGAGTGILSLFAAEAGAGRVYAVEIDPLQVEALRTSVRLNGFDAVISVVEGDLMDVDLPQGADLVVGELLDTGLLNEVQVMAFNALRERGVIGASTRVIPERYFTYAELVEVDDVYYGFRIAAPRHDWPFYRLEDPSWHHNALRALTDRTLLADVHFGSRVESSVQKDVTFLGVDTGRANGIRLTGDVQLAPRIVVGVTNALNPPITLRLGEPVEITPRQEIPAVVNFVMSGGLGSFRYRFGG